MNEQEIIHIKELDMDIIPPSVSTFNDPNQGGAKIVVIGKPGCFTAGTPVLMFDGTVKKVEEVKEGDLVMGPDSNSRTVLELCRGVDRMFRVVPEHGEGYTVNLLHKLVVKKDGEIIEISVQDYLEKEEGWRKGCQLVRTGVDFPEKKLEVDPYVYGRTFKGGKIEVDYLINTRSNRLSFLAGLLDLKGSYNLDKQAFIISSEASPGDDRFVQNLLFLIRSLGFGVNVTSLTTIEGTVNSWIPVEKTDVEIFGNLEEIPCSLYGRVKRNNAVVFKTEVNSLSPVFYLFEESKGEYFGFTIDNDHRFLLGSFDVVRNTGKTTLISNILYAKQCIFPVGMAMSGTEDSNHFYGTIMPTTFVYNTYDEKNIERFITRQKLSKKHLKNPWAVIIVDDCTDEPAVFRKPIQRGMYKRGRHWKMMYILSLQYSMDIRPDIRTNVDGVFLLREPNLNNRKNMYENYASIIPDFKTFCEIMDQITEDFTALYIHNTTRSNNWQDCVFWYKFQPIPEDFRFGCDDYWDFHEERYNPDYVDPITM